MRIKISEDLNPRDYEDFLQVLGRKGLAQGTPTEIPDLQWLLDLAGILTEDGYALMLINDCKGKGEEVFTITHPYEY